MFAIKSLNALGLLIWYLDDGGLDRNDGGLRLMIRSNCFSEAEHILLQKELNDRFRLRFNIRKCYKKSTGKTYYALYLKAKDWLHFWDMVIAPYLHLIPKSMLYKVPTRDEAWARMPKAKI